MGDGASPRSCRTSPGVGSLASVLALLFSLANGCSDVKERESPAAPEYVDVAAMAGLTDKLVVGGPEKKHILEANTGGACLFDYDGDGDQDIFLTNGSRSGGFAPGKEPRALL